MTVQLLDTTVVKSGTGSCGLEAAKLTAYATFAEGRYRVPRVLHVDPEADVVVLERLTGYRTILDTFLSGRADPRLAAGRFRAAGRALAQIHQHSGTQEPWVQQITGGAQAAGDLLLHGDFGFSNVLVHPGRSALAVLDPLPPAARYHVPKLVGRPLDDLAIMMSCLLGRVPPTRLHLLPGVPRRALMEALLDGYAQIRSPETSFDQLLTSSAAHLSLYLRGRRWMPATLIPPLTAHLLRTL